MRFSGIYESLPMPIGEPIRVSFWPKGVIWPPVPIDVVSMHDSFEGLHKFQGYDCYHEIINMCRGQTSGIPSKYPGAWCIVADETCGFGKERVSL